MFLSIVLSVVQKFKIINVNSKITVEEENTFKYIKNSLKNLDTLQSIDNKLDRLTIIDSTLLTFFNTSDLRTKEILQLLNEKFLKINENSESLNMISKKLDNLSSIDSSLSRLNHIELKNLEMLNSINQEFKKLSSNIETIQQELKQNQMTLFNFLENSLNKLNKSLEDAVEKLAEGATEEIIKALENVIQDFNQNLTEQFGDNFRQLNESVKNMILWQENYKNAINEMEKAIKLSLESIILADDKLSNMTDNYQKIDITHKNLTQIIKTNDNQIRNIEIFLEKLGSIGEKSKLMLDSLENFSDKMKGTISNQSEILNKLIKDSDILKKEIEKQLPQSLGELNKALTSLTNKFKDDYDAFLENISKIMKLSNKL